MATAIAYQMRISNQPKEAWNACAIIELSKTA